MRNDLDEKGYVVLTLDTSTEKFHQFSIPTPADDYSKLNLEVLGDYIFVFIIPNPQMIFGSWRNIECQNLGPCFILLEGSCPWDAF